MAAIDKVKSLVDVFERDVEIARNLDSPNLDDDLAIKTAIVGFSYSSATSNWGRRHFEFLRDRLARDYDVNDARWYGDKATNVRLFFSLSMGYLLGLFQEKRITEEEFRVAELQIPGLIMLHLGRLTGHES